MRNLITVVFSLFSIFVFAQTPFLKGYFIDNNNVRTDCYIRNINSVNTPSSFDYKLTEDGKTARKTYNDVLVFEIEEVIKCIKATVEMDRHPRDFNLMDRSPEIKLNSETHFLTVLEEGNFNLYQYEENGLVRFFYSVGEEKEIKELLYKEYLDPDNAQGLRENKFYLRQLMSVIKSEQTPQSEIEKVQYKRSDLEKYFKKVNENVSGVVKKNVNKQPLGSFNFKFESTFNFINLSQSSDAYFNRNFNVNGITAVGFGVELEFVLPHYNNNLSIFLEPNVVDKNHSSQTTTFDTYTGVYSEKKLEANINIFNLPIGFRYSTSENHKFRFHMDISVLIAKSTSHSVKIGGVQEASDNINISSNFFGIGIGYNSFELAYKTSFSVSKDKEALIVDRSYLALRYRLPLKKIKKTK